MTPRIQNLHRTAALPLLLAASSAAFTAGCGDVDAPLDPTPADPATAYVERGPHGVGHRVVDADGLLVKGWYPATDADAAIEYTFALKFPGFPADPVSAFGSAVADAAPAAGRFPLVVFSHGFGLNPEWYHGLAEHLASHGVVVLAPEHTEGDWSADVVRASIARPAEVSATIDFALDGPFAAQIDGARIAVAGHSYGGYTALASAGARFDLERLEERCAAAEDPFVQGYFCAPFVQDGGAGLAAEMGLDEAPAGLWPALGDDRVDAILAIAGDAHLFGERGLAQVDVPVMFIGGTADTGAPWDWATGLSFEHVASADRTLVAFEGAEHFVSVASCDDLPFMGALPDEMQAYICDDPAWEKGAELDRVNHFAAAFVKHALNGSAQAEAALDAGLYGGVEGLSVTVERRWTGPGAADGAYGPVDEPVGPVDL